MFTGTSLEFYKFVSFEIVGWDITHEFVYFPDLELLLDFWPQMHCFHRESSIQTALKFE